MNPATVQQKRIFEANREKLGGDFADWCRTNRTEVGGSIRIVWGSGSAEDARPGRTAIFRVTAIGNGKLLALNFEGVEVCLASEDWPVYSIEATV